MERKTALTFEEKITAAFMHYVRMIDQQDIAMLYGVNIGRVNTACLTVKRALVEGDGNGAGGGDGGGRRPAGGGRDGDVAEARHASQ